MANKNWSTKNGKCHLSEAERTYTHKMRKKCFEKRGQIISSFNTERSYGLCDKEIEID